MVFMKFVVEKMRHLRRFLWKFTKTGSFFNLGCLRQSSSLTFQYWYLKNSNWGDPASPDLPILSFRRKLPGSVPSFRKLLPAWHRGRNDGKLFQSFGTLEKGNGADSGLLKNEGRYVVFCGVFFYFFNFFFVYVLRKVFFFAQVVP